MDEFEFIKAITPKKYNQPSLLKGIGDDTAVFRPTDVDVVTAVDTFVENIHFSHQTMRPHDIGYRALAVNLSDIAAMGATPKFYLVSIVVPESYSDNTLRQIFLGMREHAAIYGIDLIGGDTVAGKELTISITIIGYVAQNKARYRHTAADGDIVFVTGTLGDANAGLDILLLNKQVIDEAYFIQRHRRPSPRIAFAEKLKQLDRVTLNDVSDGIASELNEIAETSKVTITIDDSAIPIHDSFVQFHKQDQHHWKYFGGEDFELVGTVSEAEWESVKEIAKKTNTPITKIGRVAYNEEKSGHVYVQMENGIEQLNKAGYNHFK